MPSGTGFLFGRTGGVGVGFIGNSSGKYLWFDGTDLRLNGKIIQTGNIEDNAVTDVTSGAFTHYYPMINQSTGLINQTGGRYVASNEQFYPDFGYPHNQYGQGMVAHPVVAGRPVIVQVTANIHQINDGSQVCCFAEWYDNDAGWRYIGHGFISLVTDGMGTLVFNGRFTPQGSNTGLMGLRFSFKNVGGANGNSNSHPFYIDNVVVIAQTAKK